ncbi:Aste57867_9191 [Aphanomyces stellatus]|uniref:Aste57867_9191 protein n=1 Tax=Aphanomyces stellatus TaxID=120398 RepID=A0A485KMK9_9STRA|nr:hypothetical protein As57867_009155 [Aphanomyces stellatus]VFT86074.1 Aste57867_9191 [Aphanomyces stellatus]
MAKQSAVSPLSNHGSAFDCPPLHADAVHRLKAIARQTVLDVIHHTRLQGHSIPWQPQSSDNGVLIYSGVDRTAPAGVTSWLSVSTIPATIDDVASMFYSANTREYQQYLNSIQTSFKDGTRLYTLERPKPHNPRHYVGVNWALQTSPLAGIGVKPRDYTFVEMQVDTVIEGARAWVHAATSVDLTTCPPLATSHGIVRAHLHRLGYVFTEIDGQPNQLRVIQLMQVDPRGKLSDYVLRKVMHKRLGSLADRLNTALRSHRLSRSAFIPEADLVPRAARQHCHLCKKTFGLLATKGRCRKCGEVICRSCSKVWDVVDGGLPTKRRVCTVCCLHVPHFHSPHVSTATTTPSADDAAERSVFILDDEDEDFSDAGETLVNADTHNVYRPQCLEGRVCANGVVTTPKEIPQWWFPLPDTSFDSSPSDDQGSTVMLG